MVLLMACSVNDARLVARAINSKDIRTLTEAKAHQYIRNSKILVRNIKTITELLARLKSQAQKKWGRERAEPLSSSTYIKYIDG